MLLGLLRRKDAWRCTCKKIPAGKKAYAALHERIHEKKCILTPCRAGEECWDGKNLAVTIEDWKFLAIEGSY